MKKLLNKKDTNNWKLATFKSDLKNILESHKNINGVILVGGTSRIPILQKTIKEITNKNILAIEKGFDSL